MGESGIEMLGAAELRRRVADGELSPVEVVRVSLDAVDAANDELNAIVTLSGTAMDQARELEAALAAGQEPGPLCGLPVGIKDVTPVRGLRHTYGSPLYADNVADVDAVVVQRLRDAGAIVLGKTNTPEFATGGNTFNDVFGPTRNPWDPKRSAGGSTGGGAAALAAGMVALAEGTDLGGSLRIPASFCGVVGLRPTPGLVPTWPSDYPWDTMQVTGFMARRAEDVALALSAVAGPSPLAPVGRPLDMRDLFEEALMPVVRGARLGYCPDVAAIGVDGDVESACRAAAFGLRDAGAKIEEVTFDLSWARSAFLALRGHWMVAQQYERLESRDRFGDNLRGNVEAGLALSPKELGRAEQDRGRVWEAFRRYFGSFDFLLTPTMAVPPFPVQESHPTSIGGEPMETYIDWVAPTFLLSLAGLPVASVPAGRDESGLPVGLQIVGPPDSEGRVLALARAVQDSVPLELPGTAGVGRE